MLMVLKYSLFIIVGFNSILNRKTEVMWTRFFRDNTHTHTCTRTHARALDECDFYEHPFRLFHGPVCFQIVLEQITIQAYS